MILAEIIQKLHKTAMDLAEMAYVAKLEGDLKKAEDLLRKAYKKESDSTKLLVDECDFEPTRSILYRSAASLAMECNDLRGAEELIAFGLSGNPPEEIAEELRDLFEKVNSKLGNPPEEIAEKLRDLLEKVNSKRHLGMRVTYVTGIPVGDVTVPNEKLTTIKAENYENPLNPIIIKIRKL